MVVAWSILLYSEQNCEKWNTSWPPIFLLCFNNLKKPTLWHLTCSSASTKTTPKPLCSFLLQTLASIPFSSPIILNLWFCCSASRLSRGTHLPVRVIRNHCLSLASCKSFRHWQNEMALVNAYILTESLRRFQYFEWNEWSRNLTRSCCLTGEWKSCRQASVAITAGRNRNTAKRLKCGIAEGGRYLHGIKQGHIQNTTQEMQSLRNSRILTRENRIQSFALTMLSTSFSCKDLTLAKPVAQTCWWAQELHRTYWGTSSLQTDHSTTLSARSQSEWEDPTHRYWRICTPQLQMCCHLHLPTLALLYQDYDPLGWPDIQSLLQ